MPNKESQTELASRLMAWVDGQKPIMETRLQAERNWIAQYLSMNVQPEDRLLWPTASNLDMGGFLTMSHVESFHSKVLNILQTAEPWADFSGMSNDQANQATRYLWLKLKNEVGIDSAVDLWLHNVAITGTRFYKASWHIEHQRVAERWTFPMPQLPPDLDPNDPQTEDLISMFLAKKVSTQFPASVEILTVIPDGSSIKKYKKFKVLYTQDHEIQEAELHIRPKGNEIQAELYFIKKTYDGVKVDPVMPEDFYKSSGPIQTCKYLAHRVWLTWNQVIQRVQEKVYKDIDLDADEALSSYRNSSMKDLRDKANSTENSSHQEKMYPFLEFYVLDDFEGDGVLEDRQIVIFENKRQIVRDELRTLSGYDYRPYSGIILQPTPDADPWTFGIGIPKMIKDIASETTATHNLTMDSATFAAIPCFFYPAHLSLKPETIRFAPGRGIPLPITDGSLQSNILIPQFSTNLNPLFMLQDRMTSLMQSVDGMTDSQPPGKLPKTATQSTQLAQQMNLRFNVLLSRTVGDFANMSGIAGLLKIISSLYQKYGDPINVIEDTGEAYTLSFPDTHSLDLKLHINSDIMNEGLIQSRSQQILQLVSNPTLLQLGAVQPENIYNALEEHLRTLKVKNPSRYISKIQARSIPQSHEDAMMLRGVPVETHPADNDQEHLQAMAQFEQTFAEFKDLPKDIQLLFQQHQQAHEKQLQSKQQAQTAGPQPGSAVPGQGPAPQAVGGQGLQTPGGPKKQGGRHNRDKAAR